MAEKVRRGLPALLEECDLGDELDREGRGVSPRVSHQRGQLWLQTKESQEWVSANTWGVRTREPDDLVLHLVEREGVTVVLDGHGLHVAELRSRGVDRSDVVKSRSHGVILETETRLEAKSEELVRDIAHATDSITVHM